MSGKWPALACALALVACAQGGGGATTSTPMSDAGAGAADTGAAEEESDAERRGPHEDASEPMEIDAGTPPGGMDAGPETRDAGPPSRDAGAPCTIAAGSLAIVEVMVASVSGSGDRGEWFEIVSLASCTIDLAGIEIESPTSTGTMLSHTIRSGTIAPTQYFVFALSGDATENHGLSFDYAYGSGAGSDVILNNGADSLTLRTGTTVIDSVSWATGGYTVGHARQLPSGSDPRVNDWARFCDATSVYSSSASAGTFYGTPGAANTPCSP